VVASCSRDNDIILWDASSYQRFAHATCHTSHVTRHTSQVTRHTSLSSLRRSLATLRGHSNWVKSIVYYPPQHTLFSASDDNSVRVWDVATGDCLSELGQVHGMQIMRRAGGRRLREFMGFTICTIACAGLCRAWRCHCTLPTRARRRVRMQAVSELRRRRRQAAGCLHGRHRRRVGVQVTGVGVQVTARGADLRPAQACHTRQVTTVKHGLVEKLDVPKGEETAVCASSTRGCLLPPPAPAPWL
jgi:hypothetical protein